MGRITGDGNPDHVAKKTAVNPVKQKLYRTLFPDAILNPPIHWMGEGFCGQSIEQQFIPYTYPMEGHPEIKTVLPVRRFLHGNDDRDEQVGPGLPEPEA